MKSRGSLTRLHKFQVDEKRRQVVQIETMIDDFKRMIEDLDAQIVNEQDRVGIHDVGHFAYPTFAKAAMTRRDNLRESLTGLDAQLAAARATLAEAFEELKKVELLEDRDSDRVAKEAAKIEQDELDDIASKMVG